MTPKKSYSRFFIILQEDEKGYSLDQDKAPSGYAKLEMKNNKCKLSYYVQNLSRQKGPCHMVLICDKKDTKKIIKIAKMNIDDYGRADVTYEYDMNNIANTDIGADKIAGAAIVKFDGNKIRCIMHGFITSDISKDWKEYNVVSQEDQKPMKVEESVKAEPIEENIGAMPRENKFDEYEQQIEAVKENNMEENEVSNIDIRDLESDDEMRKKSHKSDCECTEKKEKKKEEKKKEKKEYKDDDCKEHKYDKHKDDDCKEHKYDKHKDDDCKEYKHDKHKDDDCKEHKHDKHKDDDCKEYKHDEHKDDDCKEHKYDKHKDDDCKEHKYDKHKDDDCKEHKYDKHKDDDCKEYKYDKNKDKKEHYKDHEYCDCHKEKGYYKYMKKDCDYKEEDYEYMKDDCHSMKKDYDHKMNKDNNYMDKYYDYKMKKDCNYGEKDYEYMKKDYDHKMKKEYDYVKKDYDCLNKYYDNMKKDKDYNVKNYYDNIKEDHTYKMKQEHYPYYDEHDKVYENENNDNYVKTTKNMMTKFFKDIIKDFEKMDKYDDVKNCEWYKVPVEKLEEMYCMHDYKKYTVIYYPMISYYPYIAKHKHFMIGHKYDNNGNLKYIVYALPGKKSEADQPYGGKTGFVAWMPNKYDTEMGYWLMFYDFKNSTVVVPVKR